MGGDAFGAPGAAPTWTSSAKDLVTTALGSSRLWATFGFGILNEVYWPATGMPQLRDLGFIVSGQGRWFEVKRAAKYRLSTPKPYVPLLEVVHEGPAYELTLEFVVDPLRDVLLVSYRLEGDELRLYPLLAPHLGSSGWGNSAWTDGGRGLHAGKGEHFLSLLADGGFTRASAGYVGSSDGWQDFSQHGEMTWEFERATDGNVALIGELASPSGVLALGFAGSAEGSRTLARSSLVEGYEAVRARFVDGWERWGAQLRLPAAADAELEREALLSATVLKVHEDRTYPGAVVASLSIPWGHAHDDPGGYHLVWARDACETGLALLALGDAEGARSMLSYLVATQSADGHWVQNFYPDGRVYWTGIQLDEVGFPIVFAEKLREAGFPESPSVAPMVRSAARYLAQVGPVSPQDRWEENPGASPFTLAVEVVALVAAAGWLEGPDREYALALADCWNERIEEWSYIEGGELGREHEVDGYYVRIGAPAGEGGIAGRVQVKNTEGEAVEASALVGMEFLYLARFGLRDPHDPRITDTLKVVDSVLRVETPNGPAYRRYPLDGYGEHADGSPFDGLGIGRPWPLLAGERGHGAMLRGESPLEYLRAMARMTGPGGLIPEQVWDDEPIPERGLYPGKPTGSAMPLVWAHSEFIKLATAVDGRPHELLRAVEERYGGKRPEAAIWFWRPEAPIDRLPPGRALVIEAREPFSALLAFDGQEEEQPRVSTPTGLGMHGILVEADETAGHQHVSFARRAQSGAWGDGPWNVAALAEVAVA